MANASGNNNSSVSVSVSDFGTVNTSSRSEPRIAKLYTLENRNGVKACITDYGATLVEFHCPDRSGQLTDVVLGFEDVASYVRHGAYMGATVGRFANRIANAEFTLDDTRYSLDKNCGPHNLHGGLEGFDSRIWHSDIIESNAVRFSLFSPDGDQGFPGNVTIHVVYKLDNDNRLAIEVDASSDAATPISITNHSYFNLAGSGSILEHYLQIPSEYYTPLNEHQVPSGECTSVVNTPFDFQQFGTVGANIENTHPQLIIGGGYDHNYMTGASGDKPIEAAKLEDRTSGRGLSIFTNAPGLQLYTANFLDGSIGKGVAHLSRHAVCLEPQAIPNAPNDRRFPSSILKPGERYQHTMIFKPYIVAE